MVPNNAKLIATPVRSFVCPFSGSGSVDPTMWAGLLAPPAGGETSHRQLSQVRCVLVAEIADSNIPVGTPRHDARRGPPVL